MTTKVEWCDETWNPVTGCTPISEACQHCYASRMAKRLAGRYGYPTGDGFAVTLHPDKLNEPLRWKKPRRAFVCSMGDLFHEDVSDEWIKKVFNAMSTDILQPCLHTYMILTKRPKRMADFFAKNTKHGTEPWPNVWLGVTAENQARADERIPILLSIPAAVHFVSVEPMLEPVDLCYSAFNGADSLSAMAGIDWVIAGPETGPGARECPKYAISELADQCESARVPFFDKRKDFIRREWPK